VQQLRVLQQLQHVREAEVQHVREALVQHVREAEVQHVREVVQHVREALRFAVRVALRRSGAGSGSRVLEVALART
jgi:hypothetical protein